MESLMKGDIAAQGAEAQRVMSTLLAERVLCTTLDVASAACIDCFQQHSKILLAGNSGSVGNAQHIADELVSRVGFEGRGLPAIALTTDTSILTAIGNECGYKNLFARQVEARGNKGGVLIGYSTFGTSPNIVRALEDWRSRGLMRIGMTGNRGGPTKDLCHVLLHVPFSDVPKIVRKVI